MVEAASTTPGRQPIEVTKKLFSAIHRYPHMYPQRAVVAPHTMVSERRELLALNRHLLRALHGDKPHRRAFLAL